MVNEYQGKYTLYHFDVYRIADPDEMFDIGFDEYINGEGITIIEWGELISGILPSEIINLTIKKDLSKGLDYRLISVEFRGEKYAGYEMNLNS